jgi:uncharacterized protein (TIGR03643 family)
MPKAPPKALSKDELSRLIEMAWEDRTPFEAIEATFGFAEPQVIQLMRRELKRSSFNLWRESESLAESQSMWHYVVSWFNALIAQLNIRINE